MTAFRLEKRLSDPAPLLAVELRPPRRELHGAQAMEAWIDVYHAVQRLTKGDTLVFLTDNAVGTGEEENLNHLLNNLGADAVKERIVPFLTLKHPHDYCRRYTERAKRAGFPGLVILGGDKHDSVPRCLPHAWMLRDQIRQEHPTLTLGGWVNPHHDPETQVGYLLEQRSSLDFALAQVVSHHDLSGIDRFLEASQRRGLDLPLLAGVFYYRSARRRTLEALAQFMPVPIEALGREFEQEQVAAEEIAARTVRALLARGVRRFYLSNLETGRAAVQLGRIAQRAGLASPVGSVRG